MKKRFLFSVGDVVAMQGNEIVFTAKTLTDSGITLETSNTEVRGGKGNALQAVYYHTSTLSFTLTDVQFRLEYLKHNTGASIANGGDIWTTEPVTLTGYNGTILGNPVSIGGNEASVFVEVGDEWKTIPVNTQTKTFNASGFGIEQNATICVMYLDRKDAARQIIVPSNFVPDRLRIYVTADLFGDDSGKGKIGSIQIEIPVAQLSGAQELAMTADGVANSNLTAMAIAYNDSSVVGCQKEGYYAKITEVMDNSNWYDGVTGLAVEGGDFELTEGTSTTLRVYAVKNGSSFLCNNALLNFTVASGTGATVGATTGIVNATAEGSVVVLVKIPTTSIESRVEVTINAAE